MLQATNSTIEELYKASLEVEVFDPHTHIQDDLVGFGAAMANENLAGTQASFNVFPTHVIEASVAQSRLVRRTMMDPTHGLAYSWFAQAAEGSGGRIDDIIAALGDNSASARAKVGRMLLTDLRESRYSEYAEWIRMMFGFYLDDQDLLDPDAFDAVAEAMQAKRNDPAFVEQILDRYRIRGYVTSIENRSDVPLDPSRAVTVGDIDVSHSVHPEAYNMFDANYLVWPEGATDFGLFFAGHKYESESYLHNLEEALGASLNTPAQLRDAVHDFLNRILWSPQTNPTSRIRYTDLVHPIDANLNEPIDTSRVAAAMRYRKGQLRGDDLRHVVAFVTRAMLEALDNIGREIKADGHRYGSCLQVCLGVTYFMDTSREVQSFPVYRAGMPQDAYALWHTYPNIHFEYIIAHELLYADFSNAAKQVANLSVGPWWHYLRRHKIAHMLYDQLSMGPTSAIASGITDARFVEMLAAKYDSVRRGVATALAGLVDDPWSSLHRRHDQAIELMQEILFDNPVAVHHIPIDAR